VTFQELLLAISRFWAERGCVLQQPYDLEVGAGTMNPETFFRSLGPEPWKVAYCEPSRRPVDGRYGDNPYRLYKHYQFQVLVKPGPDDIQDVYLDSLRAFGIDATCHEIRFEEDNWESPTLGAAGVGWQVLLDGMEITQFTYFQQVGGMELEQIPVEITYGLERIAMYLTGVGNVFNLPWNDQVTYGEVRHQDEFEQSKYGFQVADVALLQTLFERHADESVRTLDSGLVMPAYEHALRCSHTFNLLDARGAVSVTERPVLIARVRRLACATAKAWLQQRADQEFPLLSREAARVAVERWEIAGNNRSRNKGRGKTEPGTPGPNETKAAAKGQKKGKGKRGGGRSSGGRS
jgi:glycyl-tRNA synthetase alpha chain